MAKRRVVGVNARPVEWVRCEVCGAYYYPRNDLDVARHEEVHRRAVEGMDAIRDGWAFLLGEAEDRYVLGDRRPRPMADVEEGLRALDAARSAAEGPVRSAGGRLFGRSEVMAALVRPYQNPVVRGQVWPSATVRAFPRWVSLLHTGLFGAERFRLLGWIAASAECSLSACGGPPYEPWREPYLTTGANPRHLNVFLETGRLDALHEATTPNCRRVVQGKIDAYGRKTPRPQ